MIIWYPLRPNAIGVKCLTASSLSLKAAQPDAPFGQKSKSGSCPWSRNPSLSPIEAPKCFDLFICPEYQRIRVLKRPLSRLKGFSRHSGLVIGPLLLLWRWISNIGVFPKNFKVDSTIHLFFPYIFLVNSIIDRRRWVRVLLTSNLCFLRVSRYIPMRRLALGRRALRFEKYRSHCRYSLGKYRSVFWCHRQVSRKIERACFVRDVNMNAALFPSC